jgi:hypothetical protein
LVAVANIDIK